MSRSYGYFFPRIQRSLAALPEDCSGKMFEDILGKHFEPEKQRWGLAAAA